MAVPGGVKGAKSAGNVSSTLAIPAVAAVVVRKMFPFGEGRASVFNQGTTASGALVQLCAGDMEQQLVGGKFDPQFRRRIFVAVAVYVRQQHCHLLLQEQSPGDALQIAGQSFPVCTSVLHGFSATLQGWLFLRASRFLRLNKLDPALSAKMVHDQMSSDGQQPGAEVIPTEGSIVLARFQQALLRDIFRFRRIGHAARNEPMHFFCK